MKKEEQEMNEMAINQAEIVPHPRNPHDAALFIHEPYHLLSAEDTRQPEEE